MPLFGGALGGNNAGAKGADLTKYWQADWALPGAQSELGNDYFEPFQNKGAAATDLLASILGANGPDAAKRAYSRFAETPAYRFRLNQGIDAINRAASARGTLAGGQTSMDLMGYGQGLAGQEFDNWTKNLMGLSEIGLTGASGRLSRDKARAGLYQHAGDEISQAWREGLLADQKANNAAGSNLLSTILGGAKLAAGGLGGKLG